MRSKIEKLALFDTDYIDYEGGSLTVKGSKMLSNELAKKINELIEAFNSLTPKVKKEK